MQTDELIRNLTDDLKPVPQGSVERRLAYGILIGAIVTLGVITFWLGFRADLGPAMLGFPFWMKWAYTISLAVGAIVATFHLSRPEVTHLSGLWLLALPLLALAGLAGLELVRTPVADWPKLLEGRSATVCSLLVLFLSLPIFGGLIWAFRKLAPGNLRLAGAVAGFASGASAATLYSLHCPETAAVFILIWYTLGMMLAGLIGFLMGPRLLRW